MKFKTTKKKMKDNYNTIIKVGYCSIAYLLQYEQPIAYSAGSSGWSCDYYEIDGILISTGYAPVGNIEASYDLCHKYNVKAENVVLTRGMDWNDKKDIVRGYLKEFIKEVTNNVR
jgi:hypothetical protein